MAALIHVETQHGADMITCQSAWATRVKGPGRGRAMGLHWGNGWVDIDPHKTADTVPLNEILQSTLMFYDDTSLADQIWIQNTIKCSKWLTSGYGDVGDSTPLSRL